MKFKIDLCNLFLNPVFLIFNLTDNKYVEEIIDVVKIRIQIIAIELFL